MRTTLTLDDDVVAAIERRRAGRGTRLRDEINDLLRAGLASVDRSSATQDSYELPTFDPGRPLISDSRLLSDLLDDEDIERAMPTRT